MQQSYLCLIFYILKHVLGEWVEIPQVSNTKAEFKLGVPTSFPVTTPINEFTTVSNYETIMKTPYLTDTGITTIQPEVTTNIYSNQNTTKANVNKTRNNFAGSEFLTLMETIQRILTQGAKKSLRSKLLTLLNLKDHLLANIDRKITTLWNPDTKIESRGHHDDYEMDFPSNEGALMTIGFLTFAVFLIKIILKLIQGLKSKTNNGTVMVVTTMPPTAVATAYLGKRRKREIDNQDAIEILRLIEEYNFQ